MKYLAIASVLAATTFGVGTAFAFPDLSAARESGAAESLTKTFNQPTLHAVRNGVHGPLYMYAGTNQPALLDFGIAAQR